MSPFFFIQFLICGIIFYGNCLPYQNLFAKHSDQTTDHATDYYFDDYYFTRKVPKLKKNPEDKFHIYSNLGWFPADQFKKKQREQETGQVLPDLPPPEPYTYQDAPWDFDGNGIDVEEMTTINPPHLKEAIKKKFYHYFTNQLKNFTMDENLSNKLKKFKNESVHKVKDYLRRKHFKEAFKDITHPLRYRGCKKPNTTTHYDRENDLDLDWNLAYLGPRIRIYPKSSSAEVFKESTTMRPTTPPYYDSHFSFPRKIKVIIDTDTPERPLKLERNVNDKSYYEGDSNNSTNVLEAAGEMASDLAGRVTSLWHCVLGSHRIPETRDVKFYLYTRRNTIQPELLKVNYDLINQKLKSGPTRVNVECADLSPDQIGDFQRIADDKREIIKSNFLNLNAPTKILIHGYTGSYKDSRMAKIKDAYLTNGRYNVIQVDWELLAAPPCYIRVTHHSKFVGETIAQFLNGLYLVGLNMSLVHLVGFSLGAQVAGFTGNNLTVIPICRITGLDPALPLFLHTQPSGHLDRLDAKFVDVIHTCGGILAMLDPLGHVDFYPNGGTRQPGCEFSNLKCSHSRAPQYFAESVVSQKKFTGQLCLTWEEYVAGKCNNATDIAYMGEPCSRRSVFGKYYLLTKSKEPFVL